MAPTASLSVARIAAVTTEDGVGGPCLTTSFWMLARHVVWSSTSMHTWAIMACRSNLFLDVSDGISSREALIVLKEGKRMMRMKRK